MGYKIPGATSKEIYSLEILSMILGDGRSSRFYNDIVYSKKMAKSVSCFVWDNEIGGLFIIASNGFKTTNLDSLEAEVTSIINRIQNEEITDIELEKAKNSIENDYINNMQTILGKADALAHYWTFFKNTDLINSSINSYLGVTKEDIINSAKKYLNNSNRVVLQYQPKPNSEKKVN